MVEHTRRYTKNPTYPGNLASDLEKFREMAGISYTLRGQFLRFISANQHYLTTEKYADKAHRGYLKDLTDWDVTQAVEEIMRNKS